jgi:phage repressor protein C with HTH and peptisase S24 domain
MKFLILSVYSASKKRLVKHIRGSTINGEDVCKKFYLKDGKCRPLSLNPRYAPIEITENAEMKIYSKVVGLAEGR